MKRHSTRINGREYAVAENVFSPEIFLGTEWLANRVIEHVRGSSFLEIGVGCGCAIIELALTKKCSFMIGCDISPTAVQNTRENS